MNHSEREIESLLNAAPKPAPPADLRNRLVAGIALPLLSRGHGRSVAGGGFSDWLRHWWPALAPAVVSVACATMIVHQQLEISEIKKSIRELKEQPNVPTVVPQPKPGFPPTTPSDAEREYQEEIDKLRTEAAQLGNDIAQLENTSEENEQLRQQLSRPLPSNLPPEFQEAQQALETAKERANSIACVNNLKQFGLAARLWAMDHGDLYPPDVILMSNELSTPKILVCPADNSREAAPSWESFSAANLSYDYLAPNGSDRDPQRVLSRCRIHGNIGLCDGSVQMFGTNYAERVVQRDGKLYMK